MKLLAVDIGNTDIKFGVFEGKDLVRQWRVPGSRVSPEKFSATVRDSLAQEAPEFERVVYATVVPEVDAALRKTLRYCYNLPESAIFTIAPGRILLPLDTLDYPPEQLGMDRLVNACAARLLHPREHLLVVDFGTATTFDLVTSDGRYLGGAIAPGLKTFSESLALKTSRLPVVEWERPFPAPLKMGRNTMACMQAGLGIGYRGLVRELLKAAVREFENPFVKRIATGGLAETVLELCGLEEEFDRVDPSLTLKGLTELYEYNRASLPC